MSPSHVSLYACLVEQFLSENYPIFVFEAMVKWKMKVFRNTKNKLFQIYKKKKLNKIDENKRIITELN